jgi:hypothetical protein
VLAAMSQAGSDALARGLIEIAGQGLAQSSTD